MDNRINIDLDDDLEVPQVEVQDKIDIPLDEEEEQQSQPTSKVESEISAPSVNELMISSGDLKSQVQRQFTIHYKIQAGITQYYENIEYIVESQDNISEQKVTRTYTHFEWLHEILKQEQSGIVIPALPLKSVLAKLHIIDSTNSIRDKRYYQLIEFLKKIVLHPQLAKSKHVEIFFSGSLSLIRDELIKLEQYKSYAHQMSNLIINTGISVFSLAKGSIKYLSSLMNNNQVKLNIIPDFISENDQLFDSWEEILIKEFNRTKKISDTFNIVNQAKLDQIEEIRKIDQQFAELEQNSLNQQLVLDKEIKEKYLNQIKKECLYQLELFVLDLEEGLKLVKKRQSILQLIRANIRNHNECDSLQQQIEFKTALQQFNKELQILELNFKNDISRFAENINTQLAQLIQIYYSHNKEMHLQLKQCWQSNC